jgi:7,8-dihydroneopterin aldolase/epimerase/oxygenase
MDRVFISGLQVDTVIGVYEWERHVRQTLVLDLEMAWDNRAAAVEDDVGKALDYAAVAERVIAYVEGSAFELVEALAEQVAALVRDEFNVPWLRLRLAKPGAVAAAREVGVEIQRGEPG